MKTISENWQQVRKIFNDAIKQSPKLRSDFLARECCDDKLLRDEVESLLEAYDSEFLEKPPIVQTDIIIPEKNTDSEPTKIFADNETGEGETAPTKKRFGWTFALGCVVFVLMIIYAGINVRQAFLPAWDLPFDVSPVGDRLLIYIVDEPHFREKIKEGDELKSFNGQMVTNISQFNHLWLQVKAGDRYTIAVKRREQASEFEFIAEPIRFDGFLHSFITAVLMPVVFLLTGLLVFLFKPKDKRAFLLAMMFALFLPPRLLDVMEGLPPGLVAVRLVGFIANSIGSAVWLHFFLIFPERSSVLRRVPALERLIYLPCLLFILPGHLLAAAKIVDYKVPINSSVQIFFLVATGICGMLYFLACVPAFWINFRQADEVSRRRLRVILFGLSIGLLFLVISILTGIFLWLLNFNSEIRFIEQLVVISESFLLLIPPVFAYAIVRHKVIPVSFIIRRGLQYLLAKNALRLLLILPVVGIIWNVAANPNRTIYEILFQNSFAFYFFIVLAFIAGVLMRSRLNEWIDKKFFREQYNQERLLRELTEDVKESDSLPKLSRLVSSKIQSALHPSSVSLFFQEDRSSDFSLGYASDETSANLKLAAESPLLRLMQNQSGAIEFPTRQTDHLPPREKRWLRETGAKLLVPLRNSDGNLSGIFSLGEKKSEIPYTNRDKELLETLANQIALVHENLNLKDRVRREQRIKTEILSRFDESSINLLKECPKCGRCFDRAAEKCSDDHSELTFTLPVERTIENRYRLEKLIGKGGMGTVYEATDLRLNRTVAVKILSGAMFGNREALRRFEREAQTAAKLNHRNIVTIFDYGVLSTEGAFLVMELVRGETLSEVLRREGKLDAETVKEWFAQILDGVDAAHRSGIIHRDLKPENIFVTRDDEENVRLCILDFGLARFNEHEPAGSVTVPGMIMGTPGYMPPEQLRGERTNERGDLFAVGVMIYECLHGEKPFAGKTYREILQSMEKGIEFDKNEPFAKLLEGSLAQYTVNRFASANLMKRALQDKA